VTQNHNRKTTPQSYTWTTEQLNAHQHGCRLRSIQNVDLCEILEHILEDPTVRAICVNNCHFVRNIIRHTNKRVLQFRQAIVWKCHFTPMFPFSWLLGTEIDWQQLDSHTEHHECRTRPTEKNHNEKQETDHIWLFVQTIHVNHVSPNWQVYVSRPLDVFLKIKRRQLRLTRNLARAGLKLSLDN